MLIIGDTPFDGLAAKAAGLPFLAVCTGKYDPSAFQDGHAVAVIDTLAEGYETILGAMQGEAVGNLDTFQRPLSNDIVLVNIGFK